MQKTNYFISYLSAFLMIFVLCGCVSCTGGNSNFDETTSFFESIEGSLSSPLENNNESENSKETSLNFFESYAETTESFAETTDPIIAEKNIFEDKTMACLGDSITYGYVTKQGGQYENPYPKLLKESLDFVECYNYGAGSSTLASGENSYKPFVDRMLEREDELDIIAVMGGTNDWSRNIPLGTPDSTDPSTVYGALHTLAAGLKEKYPNAYIFFMSPLPRKETWDNSKGYTVEDVAEAVEYVAVFHNLGFLDMYRLSGFENEIRSEETDGVHPSQYLIQNSITPTIAQFLKENYH